MKRIHRTNACRARPATGFLVAARVLVIALFLLTLAPAPLAAQTANVRINTDSGSSNQGYPSIALDAQAHAYLVWNDNRNGDSDVYFASSTDGGRTWTDPNVRLNDDTGTDDQRFPQIAASVSGEVYVVWEDYRNSGPTPYSDMDIYLARSADGGNSWSPNRRVNDDASGFGQGDPWVAVDAAGNAYVAWADGRDGALNVYFAKTTNGGATWSQNVRLTSDGSWPRHSVVTAVSSSDVYVAWVENEELSVLRSTDGGQTWGPAARIGGTAADVGSHSSLAVDATGTLHAVWEDRRNGNAFDIYHARSTDGGQTWSADVKVNQDLDSSKDFHQYPTVAVDGAGSVYVSWEGWTESVVRPAMYLAKSADGGATWTLAKLEPDRPSDHSRKPTMAVSTAGNLYVAWEDGRNGEPDIYFARADAASFFGGLPVRIWWVLLMIVVAIVVILLFAGWRRRRRASRAAAAGSAHENPQFPPGPNGRGP